VNRVGKVIDSIVLILGSAILGISIFGGFGMGILILTGDMAKLIQLVR
jgi:hypothetical protein